MKLHHPVARVLRALCAFVLLTLQAGCTTVPTAQFTAYRSAFDRARTAGEQVLLDYGAAVAEASDFRAAAAAATRPDGRPASDPRLSFSVNDTGAPSGVAGDIAVRLQAWQVLADYNEALARIAEGRSTAEVEGAVDGLIESIRAIPLDLVSDALKTVAPYAGDVRAVVRMVEQEYERRRFVESVRAADPLVHAFVQLLLTDAQYFYNERYFLYQAGQTASLARARTLTLSLKPLLDQYATDPTAVAVNRDDERDLIDAVNRDLKSLPGTRPGHLLSPGMVPAADARRAPQVSAQIASLAAQIHDAVATEQAGTAEMVRYVEVLRAYVAALRDLDRSMTGLATAAARRRGPPDVRDLVAAGTHLRNVIATYQAARSKS